jgi:hypothetical protein
MLLLCLSFCAWADGHGGEKADHGGQAAESAEHGGEAAEDGGEKDK